jgi:hypothetical protein
MQTVAVLAAAMACTRPPVAPPSPACAGTRFESLAPESPFTVTGFVWLDATTVIALVGGGFDPHSNGVLVLDVAHRAVTRAFRASTGPLARAALRSGSHTELLIDVLDDGSERVGTLDIATGCARTTTAESHAQIVLDPVNDGFVIAGPDNLVRLDANTLRRGSASPADRLDAIAYDATTNALVTSSNSGDTIRVRDPVTLAERGVMTLAVSARAGFTVRPRHGEIVLPYSLCTPTGRHTVEPDPRITCREGTIERGLLIASLRPLAEVQRVHLPEDADCDIRRIAWTIDGSRAFLPCNAERELAEWTPDTGAVRMMPRPPLQYWSVMALAPDGDTYAAVGAHATIEVRSLSSGDLLWQLPLRR